MCRVFFWGSAYCWSEGSMGRMGRVRLMGRGCDGIGGETGRFFGGVFWSGKV